MSSEILNSYYSMVNYTWLCDKVRIFQSSNNWMSNFMQRYNFAKKKCSNKKSNTLEESRLRCQRFHSYFNHMLCTNNFYHFYFKKRFKYGPFRTHRR